MKKWKKFRWFAIAAMAVALGCNDEEEVDFCPNDPKKIVPGVCGCGVPDTIDPKTGNVVCEDLCPDDPNKTAPGACGCGVADVDANGNTIMDCLEENVSFCRHSADRP
ncbi:MAG: hypothetical protein FWC40_05450 [Proteobacteria bacterium]|nr:hypothetical protein [Pseudomonadota bacterium]